MLWILADNQHTKSRKNGQHHSLSSDFTAAKRPNLNHDKWLNLITLLLHHQEFENNQVNSQAPIT